MIPLKNFQFHTTLFGELDVPVDNGLLKILQLHWLVKR